MNIVAGTEELQAAIETSVEGSGPPLEMEGPDNKRQMVWELPLVMSILNGLLVVIGADGDSSWSRPSLGTQLDPETLRRTVALRVKSKICE